MGGPPGPFPCATGRRAGNRHGAWSRVRAGIAALTNLSRIGSREHWLSDTVASSVLGYGLGRLFWQSGRDLAKGEPRVYFDGSMLGMQWDW